MRYRQSIIVVMCLLVLMQCSKGDQSTPVAKQRTSLHKEASFGNSERKKQLKDAAAIIDTIYRTYAVANHFPAMVYGVVMDGELVVSGAVGYTDVSRRV